MPGYAAASSASPSSRWRPSTGNCPQHITPRFTQAELEVVLEPVRDEIAALRRENERLRRALAAREGGPRMKRADRSPAGYAAGGVITAPSTSSSAVKRSSRTGR